MKTNNIILPKIPDGESPELKKFLDDLLKVIYELNRTMNDAIKDFRVPQKKAGGVRNSVPSKPDNPVVGSMYYEDDDENGHVNCVGVCTKIDEKTGVPTWSYVQLVEAE